MRSVLRYTVDPLTYKEYTGIDKAQSAAVALSAHLQSSSSAAGSIATPRKHPRSSTASARAEAYNQQRQRFNDSAPQHEGVSRSCNRSCSRRRRLKMGVQSYSSRPCLVNVSDSL